MGVSLLLDEMTEASLADYCRKLGHDALDRIGVLFQANDRTPPFETANIVDAIADHADQQQVVESETPFHLTTAWL
jgi:hypothetical protein